MTENVLALREALEPCPFCGGRPVTACLNDDGDRWVVRCISCGAEGGWGKTATSAERYWSMRTPAAVRAETLAGAGVVEALRAIATELDAHWEHGEDCGVWATDDETDEMLYPGDLPGRHEACDCGIARLLRQADDALTATPPTPALTAERCAWAYTDAYDRLVTCGAAKSATEHEHWSECSAGHPDWWACHPFLAPPTPALTAARSEFRALVDEARANHVRWEHGAEVLEECLRSSCIGAKMLLWPDIENPRSSALPATPPTPALTAARLADVERVLRRIVTHAQDRGDFPGDWYEVSGGAIGAARDLLATLAATPEEPTR